MSKTYGYRHQQIIFELKKGDTRCIKQRGDSIDSVSFLYWLWHPRLTLTSVLDNRISYLAFSCWDYRLVSQTALNNVKIGKDPSSFIHLLWYLQLAFLLIGYSSLMFCSHTVPSDL